MANYAIVHTTQKTSITNLTFKRISEQLPPGLFIRIRKSYLDSAAAVLCVENNGVNFGNCMLPIS